MPLTCAGLRAPVSFADTPDVSCLFVCAFAGRAALVLQPGDPTMQDFLVTAKSRRKNMT